MVIIRIIMMIIAMMVSANTGMHLWNWFIKPLGMMEITMAHAYGIDLLISFWVIKVDDVKERGGDEESIERMLTGIVISLIALAMGYVTFKIMKGY